MSRIYKRITVQYDMPKCRIINFENLIRKDLKNINTNTKLISTILSSGKYEIKHPVVKYTKLDDGTDNFEKNYPITSNMVYGICHYATDHEKYSLFPNMNKKNQSILCKKSISVIGKIDDYVYSIHNFIPSYNTNKIWIDTVLYSETGLYNIYRFKLKMIEILLNSNTLIYHTDNVSKTTIDVLKNKNINELKFKTLKSKKYSTLHSFLVEYRNKNLSNVDGKKFDFIKQLNDNFDSKTINNKIFYSNKLKDIIDVCREHYFKVYLRI